MFPGPAAGGARRRRPRRRWLYALVCVVLSVNLYLWRGLLLRAGRSTASHVLPAAPTGPVVTFGTMGTTHEVLKYGAGSSGMNVTGTVESWKSPLVTQGSLVVPAPWDSRLCLEHWGRSELQTEVDPKGYVVFVSGAEQLGGNKYLLADGLFIAKMLDRTLVEYPVRNARIAEANATLGLGAYWDLSAMCMAHRILDLRAFRVLVETKRLLPEDFVTIETSRQGSTTSHFRHSINVKNYYEKREHHKVIVMEHTWKSGINRHTMDYLHPNPFYLGVARMLMVEHEDFRTGEFLAVQWRTETATGDMAVCYNEVRAAVEEQRELLGFSVDQVLFSTDMFGSTSGTFTASKKEKVGGETLRRIRRDYPRALDNRLHNFFNKIEDSGVKAIVSGLVIAQARVMLASSLNLPSSKSSPEAGVCQKPYSGYIQLITEWRTDIMRKDPDTVIRLFPFGDMNDPSPATSTDSTNVIEEDGEGKIIAAAKDDIGNDTGRSDGEGREGGGDEPVVGVGVGVDRGRVGGGGGRSGTGEGGGGNGRRRRLLVDTGDGGFAGDEGSGGHGSESKGGGDSAGVGVGVGDGGGGGTGSGGKGSGKGNGRRRNHQVDCSGIGFFAGGNDCQGHDHGQEDGEVGAIRGLGLGLAGSDGEGRGKGGGKRRKPRLDRRDGGIFPVKGGRGERQPQHQGQGQFQGLRGAAGGGKGGAQGGAIGADSGAGLSSGIGRGEVRRTELRFDRLDSVGGERGSVSESGDGGPGASDHHDRNAGRQGGYEGTAAVISTRGGGGGVGGGEGFSWSDPGRGQQGHHGEADDIKIGTPGGGIRLPVKRGLQRGGYLYPKAEETGGGGGRASLFSTPPVRQHDGYYEGAAEKGPERAVQGRTEKTSTERRRRRHGGYLFYGRVAEERRREGEEDIHRRTKNNTVFAEGRGTPQSDDSHKAAGEGEEREEIHGRANKISTERGGPRDSLYYTKEASQREKTEEAVHRPGNLSPAAGARGR